MLDSVHAAYLDTLSRAATGRLLTNRSRTQLKQACLAASTYKVLAEAVPVRMRQQRSRESTQPYCALPVGTHTPAVARGHLMPRRRCRTIQVPIEPEETPAEQPAPQ